MAREGDHRRYRWIWFLKSAQIVGRHRLDTTHRCTQFRCSTGNYSWESLVNSKSSFQPINSPTTRHERLHLCGLFLEVARLEVATCVWHVPVWKGAICSLMSSESVESRSSSFSCQFLIDSLSTNVFLSDCVLQHSITLDSADAPYTFVLWSIVLKLIVVVLRGMYVLQIDKLFSMLSSTRCQVSKWRTRVCWENTLIRWSAENIGTGKINYIFFIIQRRNEQIQGERERKMS